MPKRPNTHMSTPGRSVAPRRRLGAVLIAMGLIATTSCTQDPEPETVSDPVKLLQNVHVDLSRAAGIQTIEGTTISVAADGNSSAEDTQYKTDDVVGELPVRVSLQYRAGDKSGSDLTELQGHSGPVEINLTLENLTVKPQVVEYDSAGQSRSETAFVGAPLTIAASTTLPGVRADDITPGSADGATGTNGVLSSTGDGATVVQWATVLAPPRSGASTTLRLVADVKDFQVPAIDVAVQPGLNTDLTADGVVSGAFSSGTGSEIELQRRTIALVSDVNTVLIKAGSTITEVRRNLQETSQTLGVRTAEELRDNSDSLAATMVSLKDQLEFLGSDLETATTGTQSVTMSQLQQTVSAVDAMLGDTSTVPPTVTVTGDGCVAEVAKPQQSASVYGSILTMSSQLDAYATVSADCRDFVAGELQAAIGPEEPTLEVCEAERTAVAEKRRETVSMTCSLRDSGVIIGVALTGLVKEGEELVKSLDPDTVIKEAVDTHTASAAALELVRTDFEEILDGADASEDYKTALREVTDAIKAAETSVAVTRDASKTARSRIDGLHRQLADIRGTAAVARTDVADDALVSRSMTAQNQKLADELCKMANDGEPRVGKLSARDVEELRAYLTDVPCDYTPEEGVEMDPLPRPGGFPGPMDARLETQAGYWDAVIASTDTTAVDQEITQAFAALDAAIDDVDAELEAISSTVEALDISATEDVTGTKRQLQDLSAKIGEAVNSSGEVGTVLIDLQKQQVELGNRITTALAKVEKETSTKVKDAVDIQVRKVTDIGSESSESVTTAFNQSILGLKATSDEVVGDAKGTVDKQRGELNEEGEALAAALSESTESALASIASTTSGSTRDVEGANALLASSLNKVMLDLGDRSVNGSGLLGSMATNAAKADTADFQLALAAQNAEGYANIRSQDVAELLLRQAQFKASLTAVDELPPFHLEVPAGATSQTLYTLTIGGGE